MSDANRNLVALLADEATALFDPLVEASGDADLLVRLMMSMGWDMSGLRRVAIEPVGEACRALVELFETVNEGVDLDDLPALLSTLQELGEAFGEIRQLLPTLSEAAYGGGVELPDDLLAEFSSDLLSALLVGYLADRAPTTRQLLTLLTIIEEETAEPLYLTLGSREVMIRLPRERLVFRPRNIAELLSDPVDHLRRSYFPPDGRFETEEDAEAFVRLLFGRLSGLLASVGGAVYYGLDNATEEMREDPAYAALKRRASVVFPYAVVADGGAVTTGGVGARFEMVPPGLSAPSGGAGPGVEIAPFGSVSVEKRLGDWTLEGRLSGESGGFFVDPDSITAPDLAASRVEALLRGTKRGEGEGAAYVFGADGATRIELGRLRLQAEGGFDAGDVSLGVEALASDSAFILSPGDGDGFLKAILPPEGARIDFDLGVGWNNAVGLYFAGAGSLELEIPIDKTLLDTLEIKTLYLLLEAGPGEEGSDAEIALAAAVNAALTLGPLYAEVDKMGLNAVVSFPDGGGNLGPAHLELGVKPPEGLACELDGGAIRGGGALFREEGEYRGMLALECSGFALSAFGILTTELPEGEEGFSFVASLFGRLNIQLGYGFVLTGLGGIVGINRTADTEALREVLAAGRLDGLLFPSDPVRDASTILEDMASVFPTRKGQHLFGPMARVQWPTPALISGKLGVILELGEEAKLLILGSLGVVLPTEEAAIVALQVDFTGSIDFGSGAIAFDAVLANSRILSWPIGGEMALRTGWGEHAGLVASAGGLHPQYPAPTGFPELQRMSIGFGGNNPRLSLTGYMAVTTNSVQVGAAASIYVKGPDIVFVGQFTVEGNAAFDALILFNPFAFEAALALELKLLLDGDTLCGIGGDLFLAGPNEYHIHGRVWAEVLGIEVSVPFDKRWGNRVSETALTASAYSALRTALEGDEGMEPVAVTARSSGVVVAEPADGARAPLDPTGGLRYVQRAVPLGVELERLGNARIADGLTRLDLAFRDDAGGELESEPLREDFVRGQYFDLSESEKLSGEAFEVLRAGALIDGGDGFVYRAERGESFAFAYEVIELGEEEDDTGARGRRVAERAPAAALFAKGAAWGAGKRAAPLNARHLSAAAALGRVAILPDEVAALDVKGGGKGGAMRGGGVAALVDDRGEALVGGRAELRANPFAQSARKAKRYFSAA